MGKLVLEWLNEAEHLLTNAGITTARLDCLVLLSDELGCDKSWVLAHHEHVLQIEQLEKLNTKVALRTQHTPLAYLRGKAEFYGREFMVNEYVLVPRPESEGMIELLKRVASRESRTTVIDVGTGSGCLAITAKLELPNVDVIAVDIDETCLVVAQNNAYKLGAEVRFLHGDLLQPIRDSKLETQDVIVLSNLPYVPVNYAINQAAAHEPSLALYGGADGLDHYRQLFKQAQHLTTSPHFIITEALTEQHGPLTAVANGSGYSLVAVDGLAQCFKITP